MVGEILPTFITIKLILKIHPRQYVNKVFLLQMLRIRFVFKH